MPNLANWIIPEVHTVVRRYVFSALSHPLSSGSPLLCADDHVRKRLQYLLEYAYFDMQLCDHYEVLIAITLKYAMRASLDTQGNIPIPLTLDESSMNGANVRKKLAV